MIDIGEIQKREEIEKKRVVTQCYPKENVTIIWHHEDMMIVKMTTVMVAVLGCAGHGAFHGFKMRFAGRQVSTARAKNKGGAAKPSI